MLATWEQPTGPQIAQSRRPPRRPVAASPTVALVPVVLFFVELTAKTLIQRASPAENAVGVSAADG